MPRAFHRVRDLLPDELLLREVPLREVPLLREDRVLLFNSSPLELLREDVVVRREGVEEGVDRVVLRGDDEGVLIRTPLERFELDEILDFGAVVLGRALLLLDDVLLEGSILELPDVLVVALLPVLLDVLKPVDEVVLRGIVLDRELVLEADDAPVPGVVRFEEIREAAGFVFGILDEGAVVPSRRAGRSRVEIVDVGVVLAVVASWLAERDALRFRLLEGIVLPEDDELLRVLPLPRLPPVEPVDEGPDLETVPERPPDLVPLPERVEVPVRVEVPSLDPLRVMPEERVVPEERLVPLRTRVFPLRRTVFSRYVTRR